MKSSVSNSGRKQRERNQQINVYVKFVPEDDRAQDKKQPASEPRPRNRPRRSRATA